QRADRLATGHLREDGAQPRHQPAPEAGRAQPGGSHRAGVPESGGAAHLIARSIGTFVPDSWRMGSSTGTRLRWPPRAAGPTLRASPAERPVMSRLLALLYGAACYAVFLAVFLYAIALVAGFGVPRHIDNGVATALPVALAINFGLLSLFAVQHSVMARPAFKRWWTRFVPTQVERST